MVIKPNPDYYQPNQPASMQYPSAGSPSQGPPYGQGNQTSPYRQGQGYPPSNPPYPVSNSPYPPAAEPATSRGESASYYGNTQPPSYGGPQSPPYQHQNQNSASNDGNHSQHYTPPNQYNPHQQYPPPSQGPYGGPSPTASNPGDPLQYQQHHGAYPPSSPPAAYPQGSVPQTDEERGLMGAVAGGAAGGFAGHKMDHGIIGTLGGAYAGYKLEDKYKEHHNKPPPATQQPINLVSPMPNQQQHYTGQQMLGNFSSSSTKISMDRDFDLIAECTTVNGHPKLSSISLNKILANDNGHLKWVHDGGNFAGSARNVQLLDGGKKLEAELSRCDGTWVWDRIYLDEKITNDDGELRERQKDLFHLLRGIKSTPSINMSFATNTGSGSGGDGSKRGNGKSVHPVHTATSWRSNTKDESNDKLGESNQANTSAQTIASTTAAPAAPAAPTILPPRAPLPDYDFPQGCIKFAQHTAAYGRNQARRALHLAAIDRPDAWVTDLAKPIIHDAKAERGPNDYLKGFKTQKNWSIEDMVILESTMYKYHQRCIRDHANLGWNRAMYYGLGQQVIESDDEETGTYVSVSKKTGAITITQDGTITPENIQSVVFSFPTPIDITVSLDRKNDKFKHRNDIPPAKKGRSAYSPVDAIQGSLTITGEDSQNCTRIIPRMHSTSKIKKWIEMMVSRGIKVGNGFITGMKPDVHWTEAEAKEFDTERKDIVCKDLQIRVTHPLIPHGSNGPATRERITMLPWLYGIQVDHETLEMAEAGSWNEISTTHRDLVAGPATPSGLSVNYGKIPYAFPAAIYYNLSSPIAAALVGRAKWSSSSVATEAYKIFKDH
ncbi:hypothetical protein BLS_009725 [Venturia inaequalis]|uniref:Cyanovirin-N domain-containing protein n=1 Tax=Venturia inaequalis TaxID=5025 RepID=A0A8H3V377_VENIN|nr:hypothetical protein BLS_009725 [Venturia inaequalis]